MDGIKLIKKLQEAVNYYHKQQFHKGAKSFDRIGLLEDIISNCLKLTKKSGTF